MIDSEDESSADEGQSELADSIKTHEVKRKPKEKSSKDDPPKVSFNLVEALAKIPKKIPPRPKFSPNPTYGDMDRRGSSVCTAVPSTATPHLHVPILGVAVRVAGSRSARGITA